ncbi:Eukaryotic and archaeal DNA primase, large subunit [uncultured archaeon]|nr:Eukaryotic and archaeal DNA primase, large subunit [uncultured archaeon]
MRELITLAKYPFLHDTRQYIKENGPSVDELLHNLPYERARIIGIERLDNAFKNRDVGNRSLVGDSDCIMEILSYPLARMVAVCIGDSYFKKRYALGEAYHIYKYLLNEPTSFLLVVAQELNVTVQYSFDKNIIKIFFKDYLRNAPTRYREWKIVNRGISGGFLTISHKDLARILLESLRERINEELLARECDQSVYNMFSSDIQRFQNMLVMQKKKFETAPVGKVSIEKLPPCMKDILSAIQSGENVPHMGRFSLVAFLSSLKLSSNEILKLFSSAPDYQEDKTRYQVEHITGTSSSTEYKCPGCEKMRTYGICPVDKMDDVCKKVRHPLSYYSDKWKQEKKKP